MNTDVRRVHPNPNDSGWLVCEDGFIRYSSGRYGTWELPIGDVRIIGEYTNENGPFADDYFFVFLGDSRSEWWEASFYTEDREKFFAEIAPLFPEIAPLGLVGSTTFHSRVLWPPKYRGKELFTFTRLPRQPGIFGWLKSCVTSGKIERRIADGLG